MDDGYSTADPRGLLTHPASSSLIHREAASEEPSLCFPCGFTSHLECHLFRETFLLLPFPDPTQGALPSLTCNALSA